MKEPTNMQEALRLSIRALNNAPSFDTGIYNDDTGRNLSSYTLIPMLEKVLKQAEGGQQ